MPDKKQINGLPFVRYEQDKKDNDLIVQEGKELEQLMRNRRSVREFSSEPIPKESIEVILAIASSAP